MSSVLGQPALPRCPDARTFPPNSCFVDLVLNQVLVDDADHHAVILGSATDRHVAVSQGRRAPTPGCVPMRRHAAAGRQEAEGVTRVELDIGEHGAQPLRSVCPGAVQRQAVRDRRQPALDAPHHRTLPVADIGEIVPSALRNLALLRTPTPPRHKPGSALSVRISNSVVSIG